MPDTIETFKDIFDPTESWTDDDLEDFILRRLQVVREDSLQTMKTKGITYAMLSEILNENTGTTFKHFRAAFVMDPSLIKTFAHYVFPGQTIDEIFWGENIPMQLLNIDRVYLMEYHTLTKYDYTADFILCNFIKRQRSCGQNFDEKLTELQNDRAELFPEMENAPTFFYKDSRVYTRAHYFDRLRVGRTTRINVLMRYSLIFGVSLDFLLACDYSNSPIYYIKDGEKIFLDDDDKNAISQISRFSTQEKEKIIIEIEEMIKARK